MLLSDPVFGFQEMR